jgi:hypothetical protein
MELTLLNDLNIINIERSDSMDIQRLRVNFQNGYTLSIVKGWGTYCGQGTYEVAVIKDEALDYTHTNGDVLQSQTPEEILKLAKLINSLGQKTETNKGEQMKGLRIVSKGTSNDSDVQEFKQRQAKNRRLVCKANKNHPKFKTTLASKLSEAFENRKIS